MAKKDEVLSQLESVLKELQAGKEESAVALALGQKSLSSNLSRLLFKWFMKFWGRKILLIALSFIIVVSGGIWLYSGSTVNTESVTFVEHVQELSTLATAEAHIKVVIEQEDNKLFGKDISLNIPGTKREVLLVVPATVIAGVDLKHVTAENMKIDDDAKRLEITLPHSTLIQEPAIQMEQVKAFSEEGLLRGEVKWEEGFDLAAEAQNQIKEEAREIGLLQTAEKNAEKVLKEFFGNMGYSVVVTFK